MSIIVLIASASILLALLILHSYLTRGARITAVFFLLAATLMFLKEFVLPPFVRTFILPALINSRNVVPRQHYVFLIKDAPEAISKSAVVVGWMITFYLGWYFSEQILLRFNNFQKRLFTTLAFSIIVVSSVCYCLENFSMGMGWWIWRFSSPAIERFLMNCPLQAIGGWTHMSLITLLTFFLIECSQYRLAKWRGIFFLIPLIPVWFCFVFGFKNLIIMMDFAVINTIFFSFFIRLQIDHSADSPIRIDPKFSPYINRLPYFALLLMLSYVTIGELFFLKQPSLLISMIPLLMVIILSIKKLPLFYVAFLAIVMFIALKEKAVFPSIPVIYAMILWGIDTIMQAYKKPGFTTQRENP